MADRVVLFIDAQNMYQGARRAFFDRFAHYVQGQFDPQALGRLIVDRGPTTRVLQQVRVYTGRPEATKEHKSYAAHLRQVAAWKAKGVVVIPRTLRYPATWPQEKAREKGIDVHLAVDFVTLALEGFYEVGIMASADTDLVPALEYVHRKLGRTVEVVAWRSARARGRLSISGANIWCHWIDRVGYDAIADPTDYTL
ncbi:MAG: NYN domain-containing protein [Deinococcus sp.]|nr:NYN domain-containing protein [Deinococcus sp.]